MQYSNKQMLEILYYQMMHAEIRQELVKRTANTTSKENLSNEELIKENYKGIRPAPGYPACPDHLEKTTIWEVLKVKENIGVELTESLAMWPAASVSGYYFGDQESKYLSKSEKDNE